MYLCQYKGPDRFAISSPCENSYYRLAFSMNSLPALTGNKDESLQAALSRMLAEFESGARTGVLTAEDDPHVTAVKRLPAVAAQFAPFPEAMDPRLRRAMQARGLEQLYSHQAEAIDHALGGRNVVVVTPTASGKTLCYNAPVLQSILADPSSRALYLFPTKALAPGSAGRAPSDGGDHRAAR
jgi:superfamily II helicase